MTALRTASISPSMFLHLCSHRVNTQFLLTFKVWFSLVLGQPLTQSRNNINTNKSPRVCQSGKPHHLLRLCQVIYLLVSASLSRVFVLMNTLLLRGWMRWDHNDSSLSLQALATTSKLSLSNSLIRVSTADRILAFCTSEVKKKKN